MTFTYWSARFIMQCLARVWLRSEARHLERVPAAGPVILASNHASFADPPLVGTTMTRPGYFLARDTLFKIPVFGWYIRKLNAVPVNREGGGGAGLKAILDRLAEGGAILLFPEGTRSADGNLLPARSGIGLIVIKSDAPVVPVRIYGSFEAWGRHRKLPKPGKVRVIYGEPMDFSALRTEAANCDKARLKAIYQEVADAIMARIGQL